jgi:transposase
LPITNGSFESDRNQKTQIPNAVRELIIEKVIIYGESITKVTQELRLNRTTVNAIVKNFLNNGQILRNLSRRHKQKKIGEEIGAII